jgi:mono/diheme cytochrome c family protein
MRRFAFLPLLAHAACSPDSGGAWESGVFLPGEATESGDPELGRELLLNGDYMTCGIPLSLWDGADDMIAGALGGDPDGPRIEGRLGANADLPFDLNAFTSPDGVDVVNANCLSCHGGMADGELVLGLGNATADFTLDPGATADVISSDVLAALGLSEGEIAQFEMMSTRAAAIADFAQMRTVGNNPAEGLAVVLMTHHDRETLAWSDEPVTDMVVVDEDGEPVLEPIVTSDPPPWWRAKKKNALFYNGMARGDQRGTMALATSICVDDVVRALEVDEQFRHIHAYVLTVTAPAYPHPIDRAQADEGAEIFAEMCAGCHGTYAKKAENDAADTYPNLLIPLDVIGTDPVVANAGVIHAPELVEWYNDSFYGQITKMVPDDPFPGYMPPPLDGIWATAPFFHNGSVPTLELVLDSSARPKRWRRENLDSTDLDRDALGWPWEKVEEDPSQLPYEEAKWIYDTTEWSQSRAGHTFGDALEPAERRAVIEYLKTL